MSWQKVTLQEVVTTIQTGPFGSQLHQSDYSNDGIPVIMPKDLIDGKISVTSIARVSKDHVSRLSRHKISEGDILYSRRGDVGRCAYVKKEESGWICGTGCLRVSVNKEKVDSKFLFFYLQIPEIKIWLENNAIGSTMPNLNTTILGSVPLFIPPLYIQKKIANILSAYDDLIENNQKQIQLLEEAAQRLYKEWFVDLRFPGHENTRIVDGVPEGWEVCTIDDISSLRKTAIKAPNIPPGIPYIGLEHIPRKDFCLSSWGDSSDVSSTKYQYKENDILFGKIRPYFHKVGFSINNGVTSTDTLVMTAKKDSLWPILLLSVFSKDFVNYSYQNCKEGSKMPRADWNIMKSYKVLNPEKNILKKFNNNIFSITKKIKILAHQNNIISETRNMLLPKLMKKI